MVIVYTSNTGYTERYAKMLAGELNISAVSLKDSKKQLKKGEDIIYMGWLMASRVKDFAKANKLFSVKCLCGVGMGPSGSQLDEVRRAEKLTAGFPLFTIQGGFDMNRLTGAYKFAMKMLCGMLEKKNDATEAEKWMVDTIRKGGDFVSLENLSEILDFCRNMQSDT